MSYCEECAKRDRRIEELGAALDHCVGADIQGHIITREQINKAWKTATRPITNESLRSGWIAREAMMNVLKDFGIVACPKCRGTKWCSYTEYEAQRLGRTTYECDCPNNGWVIECGDK